MWIWKSCPGRPQDRYSKYTSTISPADKPVASGEIRKSPSAAARVKIRLLLPKMGSAFRVPLGECWLAFNFTGHQSSRPAWEDKFTVNRACTLGLGLGSEPSNFSITGTTNKYP